MAETALTVKLAKRSGIAPEGTPETSDEANGNSIAITGLELIRLSNTGASERTATFANQKLSNYGKDDDETCAIPAGEVRYCGPFNKARWADGAGNLIISWSASTGVEVEVEAVTNPIGNSEASTQ